MTRREFIMSTRFAITLLLCGVVASVLFGVGAAAVLSIPGLSARASLLLPIVIVASIILAPIICWRLAPMLRAKYSRQVEAMDTRLLGTGSPPVDERDAMPGMTLSAPVHQINRKEDLMKQGAKSNRAEPPETLEEAALVSPTTVFDTPEDVVESDDLTKHEKVRILDQWEADATALQTATDEGMSGGKLSRLDDVNEAKTKLG
jgi:hypothetical protein